MKVSVRKAIAEETPASITADYSSDHISAMMVQSGIQSLEVSKFVSGFESCTIATPKFFDGIPKSVMTLGYVRKDALGTLMASSNIIGLHVTMDEDEMSKMRSSWAIAAAACEKDKVNDKK